MGSRAYRAVLDAARALGLDQLADHLVSNERMQHALDLSLDFPPDPGRGGRYGQERWIGLWSGYRSGALPELADLLQRARAWQRSMIEAHPEYTYDFEAHRYGSSCPYQRTRFFIANESFSPLSVPQANRTPAFLSRWREMRVAPFVQRMGLQMALIEGLYGDRYPVHDVRTLRSEFDADLIDRILARRWPGSTRVNPRTYTWTEPMRTDNAIASETDAVWGSAGQAARASAGDLEELRARLPRGSAVEIRGVTAWGHPREGTQDSAPVLHQAVVSFGRTSVKGPRMHSAPEAVLALATVAEHLPPRPEQVDGVSLRHWRAAIRGVVGAVERGELTGRPTLRNIGGLPPATPATELAEAAAQVASLQLARWIGINAGEVGALLFGQDRWEHSNPVARTVRDGSSTWTRLDTARLPAYELAGLHAAPHTFQHRDQREITAELRAGEDEHQVTVEWTRHGGPYLVGDGLDTVRAYLDLSPDEQARRPLLVTFAYGPGMDGLGRLYDPSSGSWEPFAPGRRVQSRDVGRHGTVRRVERGEWPRESLYLVAWDGNPDVPGLVPRSSLGLLAQQYEPLPNPDPIPAVGDVAGLMGAASDLGLGALAAWLGDAATGLAGTFRPPLTNPEARVRVLAHPDGRLRVRHPGASARLKGSSTRVTLEGAQEDGVGGYVGKLSRKPKAPSSGLAMVARHPGVRVYADRGTPSTLHLVGASPPRPEELAACAPEYRRNLEPGVRPDRLWDAEGREYRAYYQVVEAGTDGQSTIVTSHQPGALEAWSPGYPREFQTRELGSIQEASKIRAIASKLDPSRLIGKHLDATMGPPVVWEGPDGRLYVLAGNGRAIALLIAPEERYRAYEEAGRREWTCWPKDPAREGYRWMLVRVVSGIDQARARQLAAASQLSQAAEEGRIGRALGLARSLDLDLSSLPPIDWVDPVSASNAGEFEAANPAWVRAILEQLDPAKARAYQDPDKLAPLIQSVLLGFLPVEAQKAGLMLDPKVADALLGALPTMVTIRSRVHDSTMFPEYDLLSALPRSLRVFAYMHKRSLSWTKLASTIEQDRQTVRIPGAERLGDTPDLSLALAAAFYNAARRAAPEVVASEILGHYLVDAAKFVPKQLGLFGDAARPAAAGLLASHVPNFSLPETGLQRDNPATPATHALLFSRDLFPSPSDARAWCKVRGIHAGVPRAAPGGWAIGPDGWKSPDRLVAMDAGVVAVVC